jgi:hypothetical protein
MQDATANEQLSAYLDGELTDAEVAELEHRLARDPTLRAELEGLRAAVDLLRTHGPATAPPALYGDVLRAVEDEPMPGGAWRWLLRPFGLPLSGLAVAAAAVAVLGLTVGGTALSLGTMSDPSSSRLARDDRQDDRREAAIDDADGAASASEGTATPGDGVADADPAPADGAYEARDGTGTAEDDQDADPASSKASARLRKKAKPAVGLNQTPPPGTQGELLSEGSPSGEEEREQLEQEQAGVATGRSGDAASATGDTWYGGRSTHKLAVKPDDLELVARIYSRYAGKGELAAARRIAALEAGNHALTLDLPDAAARNAFVQDLRRAFRATYTEQVADDDTLTLNRTRVDLVLVVQDLAPAGNREDGPIRTYRAKEPSRDRPLDDLSAPPEAGEAR